MKSFLTRSFLVAVVLCSTLFIQAQPYVIPVVVHVLHLGGAENISDAQIQDGLRILNDDYNKRNADTANIIAPFRSIAANVGIEFRLICIDRIFTPLTNSQNVDSQKINQWNPSRYLNIWTVRQMGAHTMAGYSDTSLHIGPSLATADSFPEKDGIVILNNYVGHIGTSSSITSRTLTHEAGHYLNLLHPWGGNNPGVACGDDGVNDTPLTKGWDHCPSATLTYKDSSGQSRTILYSQIDSLYAANPLFVIDSVYRKAIICTPHVVENYQNFMEFSYCSNMFTEGQKAIMLACLNSSVAHRDSLWIGAGSVTGCLNTGIGTNLSSAKSISIFPNPFNSSINISGMPEGIYSVSVFDIAGREVMGFNHVLSSNNSLNLDLNSVTAKGVYVLRLLAADQSSYSLKLVKE